MSPLSPLSLPLAPLTLVFVGVRNPGDNRVLEFGVYQHEEQGQFMESTFAFALLSLKIEVQDRVIVNSGVRNGTKIGHRIELVLDIEINQNSDQNQPILVRLAPSQVLVYGEQCQVCINDQCNITATANSDNN